MSRRQLLLMFGSALSLWLVVLLPMRLVLDPTRLAAAGLAAGDVTGSLWSGRLRATELHGRPLGDVAVSFKPLSLLRGVQRVELAMPDLSFDLLGGGRRGIGNANGRLTLDRLDDIPGVTLRLSLLDVGLDFAGGRCSQATGSVEARVGFTGTDRSVRLRGPMRCDGDRGVLAMTAASGPGAALVEAILTIESDGRYRLQSRVQPTDDATALALQLAGFRQTPSGFSRVDNGNLVQ